MRAAKSGKRPISKVQDGALFRRLAGAMPRVSALGRRRSAEWVSGIARSAAGQSLKSLIAANPRLNAVLGGIAGTAPYLWDLVCADPDRLLRIVTNSPEEEFAKLLRTAQRSSATASDAARVMRILRRMKTEAALLIALADIGGVWPLARVTASLTDVADTALRVGVHHLLAQAAKSRKISLADQKNPEVASGYMVLAMGKMGAHELNYSSDIDLMVFFDPTVPVEPFAGLLYIGYICERKNSVAVARAARLAHVPVKFVGGAPFGANDPYVDEFKSLVDGHAVQWAGEITRREQLAGMIRGARGVLLASQSEASPLSLLEALACQRPVMASALRNLRAYYGDAICYCQQPDRPGFPGELRAFFDRCQQGLVQTFPVSRWAEVGAAYARVYRQVLGTDGAVHR